MQDTRTEDPLGLVTPNPQPRCRFGRSHGWVTGFYVYEDANGVKTSEYVAGSTGVWADGYTKCIDCGQIEWDDPEPALRDAAKREIPTQRPTRSEGTLTIALPEGYENTTHIVLLAPGTGVVNPGDYYAHTLTVDPHSGTTAELEEIGGGTIRGTLTDAAKVIRTDIRGGAR